MATHSIKHTFLWILLAFIVVGAVAATALAYAISRAGYWLEAAGGPPVRADAIIILGGNDGDRTLRALALYREGYATKIVLTGLEHGTVAPPPHVALRFEGDSRNSYEEATNVLALMRKAGWRNVIAISDPPHMRRLAWTLERVFKDSGRQFILVASSAEWWSPGNWWRDEHSGSFVISEYIKLAYYMVKR
jgi:uncharacterized SAM-binding protein YcdF (DUF218 family)